MATNYPATAVDTFTTVTGTDGVDDFDHAGMHDHVQDAVAAVQTKVGVDNSADSSSLDYKVRDLTRARASVTATTSSLAPAAVDSTTNVTLAKSYRLLTISASRPCRVRLYVNAAARTVDLARPIGTDPGTNAGVVLEFVITSAYAATELALSPQPNGINLESSPNSTTPMTVQNLDSSTGTVAVTFKWIRTE